MKLCSVCKEFTLHDFLRLPDHTYSLKLSVLEAGSSLLKFQTKPSKTWIRLRNHPQNAEGKDNISQSDRGLYELELYLANSQFETNIELRTEGCFLGLAADIDSSAALEGLVAGRYYGDEPGSNVFIASILDWIGICMEHPRCRGTALGISRLDPRDVELPTRCIEIANKCIFLRDTAGQRGTYITLSHRWNDHTEQCKTTMDNLDQRKEGRAFGSLPQLFQDAMTLTQRLGVRYIWIDSLCIIQSGDGGADWENEAGLMSWYYQRSLLTISFVNEAPIKSILDARGSDPFQSLLRMPYMDGLKTQKGWYYIYRPRERPLTSFVSGIHNSDLLQRGWIFQEWFLSRRIIYCTPQQLFFECQTDLPMNERQQRMLMNQKDALAFRIRENMQKSADFDTWYTIVEMYSKTLLTQISKDHLIAISGIASEMRNKLKVASKPQDSFCLQYVSGLWYEDLHHGLLWQTRAFSTEACTCGAPSWSWASRNGGVRWLPRSSKTKTAIRINALRDSSSQLHEEADLRIRNELDVLVTLSNTNVTSSDAFNTTSMTAGIILKGQTASVMVRNCQLPNQDTSYREPKLDTMRTLARETDVAMVVPDGDAWKDHLDCLYAAEWLLICAPSSATIIGGWALLDDRKHYRQLNGYEGTILLALHIATRRDVGKTEDGFFTEHFVTGYRAVGRDVHEVLFLEPQNENRYRRIGVGRIFDSQIIADMMKSDRMEIELV